MIYSIQLNRCTRPPAHRLCACLQKELGIEAAPKPRPVREKRPKKSMEEEDDDDDEDVQDEETWAE